MSDPEQDELAVDQTPSSSANPASGVATGLGAGSGRRRSAATAWLLGLCLLQMLVICMGTAAAVYEIESIMPLGAAASVIGLAIAVIGGMSHRSFWLLGFAVSAPAFSLGVFLLIFFKSWEPSEAQTPVPPILICYEYAIIPIGLSALRQLWRHKCERDSPIGLQFGLPHLLKRTALVAIVFAGLRLALNGQAIRAALAPGFAVAVVPFVLWLWPATRET